MRIFSDYHQLFCLLQTLVQTTIASGGYKYFFEYEKRSAERKEQFSCRVSLNGNSSIFSISTARDFDFMTVKYWKIVLFQVNWVYLSWGCPTLLLLCRFWKSYSITKNDEGRVKWENNEIFSKINSLAIIQGSKSSMWQCQLPQAGQKSSWTALRKSRCRVEELLWISWNCIGSIIG